MALLNTKNIPVQPTEESWLFIDELKSPIKRNINFSNAVPKDGYAFFEKNVNLYIDFDDSSHLLDTAFNDLTKFFEECGISTDGEYKIVFQKSTSGNPESFEINVEKDQCTISAPDTEGMRRAVFALEDEIMSNCGPLLKLGKTMKESFIKNRISRCFFGPIKRPPLNRDELIDNVDYYPEEYLNRLAHDGVNGLWLTVSFKDLCKTTITPEYGKDAEKRFAKLRKTVEKCRRYGIKIFLFCIEPKAFEPDDRILKHYPELGGTENYGNIMFCPCSETAQKYLLEATETIFSNVPDLGGMINISYGERPTTCFSGDYKTCPRCKDKKPWQILHASLSAMRDGMRKVSDSAKLISWLYVPGNSIGVLPKGHQSEINEIAKNMPEDVILQYNFESGGIKEQLGKKRYAADYWQSYIGPSNKFVSCAESVKNNGTGMSAKIQVGCSHEIATIPYIPAPSLLYYKYKEMKRLGVSSVMQCWYFGNYPSVMNKAATILSFEPYPESEDTFLFELAAPDWGKHASKVVEAWKLFFEGYSNYPVNCFFQYYGPMHDGVVWPLHLKPIDSPLAPTWLLGFPPSGDRIGECVTYSHTLPEVIELTFSMQQKWNDGVKILKTVLPEIKENSNLVKEVTLAEAIGIQFKSGYNNLKFYSLREELIFDRKLSMEQKLAILAEMKNIVSDEIASTIKLIPLAQNDSRLGFHSEAEGYKYFPAKLEWRINLLEELLANDFTEVERDIKDNIKLFPDYAGFNDPQAHVCKFTDNTGLLESDVMDKEWEGFNEFEISGEISYLFGQHQETIENLSSERTTSCKIAHDSNSIYFGFICMEPDLKKICATCEDIYLGNEFWLDDAIELRLEPRRLWPGIRFFVNAAGARGMQVTGNKHEGSWEWQTKTFKGDRYWSAIIRIPFDWFEGDVTPDKPVRINCSRIIPFEGNGERNAVIVSQVKQNPLKQNRLGHSTYNPKDYERVIFE